MRFGILGPLAVTTDDGGPVVVPGAKVRMLLAVLLANRNRVVSADRLIDDLWGDDAPANPGAALQVRVSQLRKALNDAEPGARDLVESCPPGYRLRAGEVDADQFTALADSTDADPLSAALELWRGQAYADVADQEFARAEASRLTEQRLVVHERLAAARLARGEHDLVAADLAALVDRHPLREGLRALQIRALYASGRQAEALESYAGLREHLADELGLDPGPELVALHRQILDQDPALSATPKAAIVRNSLPAQLDELIGRAEALTELRALVPSSRLLTLVGPGGVGKTRLAVAVAAELEAAVFVELAPLPAGDTRVAEHVLGVLGRHEAPGATVDATERLVSALRETGTVLVLDNCEHVVEPAAELAGRLIREGVRVLATSREPLRVAGERIWDVGPLAVPDDPRSLDSVRRSAAARLFMARAAAQQRGFQLDERTAPAVARLCRRLDGLPLALELAATRVRALGVQGVVDRLGDRFALLTSKQRDVPERQRTLTAVIAWSWDLLPAEDQRALARLSVFRDGCTPEAAERVGGAGLDTVDRLVDRSLVVMEDGPRYRLLESVAEFGAGQLTGTDADELRARHTAYYVDLAERADPELRGPRQREWLAVLDAERANLRVALENGGGLRLALALCWYLYLRGRLSEARLALAMSGRPDEERRAAPWRLGFALLQGDPVPDTVRKNLPDAVREKAPETGRADWFVAHAVLERGDLALAGALLAGEFDGPWTEAAALTSRAMIAHAAGDLSALETTATRADVLFAGLGDRWGRLRAADWLGGLADMRGEADRAAALNREALRWAEELELWPEVAAKLSWLAWLAVQSREYEQGRELAERAYRMTVEQGAPTAVVFAEMCLGMAARRSGRLDVAVRHLSRIADEGRTAPQPALYLPMVLVELGYAAELLGDAEKARALHTEAYQAAEEMGAPRDTIGALEGLAAVSEPEEGARLLGVAAAAREKHATPPAPAELDEIGRVTARLVAALGRPRFDELVSAGGTSPR
ncbi:winged helix-turn-helix domain-containing protein [Actinoplanes sp. LDG1-06]|uniref:Winged helix-turn-helix domain-containing protein n=1 Tax=Paractinoplanes ovalisporus TaxID=2810368 RepID=A0ABS2A473_9ACTN|nr:BTAD domain-containing putative transcriptional regulator [Actinoplanes ovalisporus]MBM2614650.1 winged helix-turn-helix domain-containing protein [Actinoplanes ovalisporus]